MNLFSRNIGPHQRLSYEDGIRTASRANCASLTPLIPDSDTTVTSSGTSSTSVSVFERSVSKVFRFRLLIPIRSAPRSIAAPSPGDRTYQNIKLKVPRYLIKLVKILIVKTATMSKIASAPAITAS